MLNDNNHNGIPDGVESIAADASKNLHEAARKLRRQADDAKGEAVKGLNAAAAAIRREAREQGVDADALKGIDEAAVQLEKAATYLRANSYEQIGQQVEAQVKRNPLPLLALTFVIGVVIGLMLRGGGRD